MNRREGLFVVVALGIAGLLFVLTPPHASAAISDPKAQFRFLWVFSEVLIDEILVLLAVVLFIVPPVNRQFGSFLKREIRLSRPVKALAGLAVVAGLFLFAFWSEIDLTGGYAGPSRILFDIYGTYKGGVEGFSGFCVAGLGFILLRSKRGIGTALRDWFTLAAPIVMAFELAIWYFMPVDMWLHVTNLAYWSPGRYLTSTQFAFMMDAPNFSWCGNIYLLSNWNVLVLSSLVLLVSVRKEWRR
ncbi:MAG: hypothetical protein ABSB56_08445 [Nitrososphaerales archaeon]|jgi:hypothetical protein